MGRKKKKIRNLKSLRDMDFGQPRLNLSDETRRGVVIVVLFSFGILSILSLLDLAGTLGVYLNGGLKSLFGINRWYLPLIILMVAYFLMRPIKHGFRPANFLGLLLFVFGFNAFVHTIFHQNDLIGAAQQGFGGGYAGVLLAWPLIRYTGFWATLVVTIAMSVIGFLLLFESYIINFIEKRRENEDEDEDYKEEEEVRLTLMQRLKNSFTGGTKDDSKSDEDEDYEEEDEASEEGDAEEPIFSQKTVEDDDEEDDDEEEEEEEEEAGKENNSFNVGVGKFKDIKVDWPLDLLDGKTSTPKGGDIKANKEIIRKTLKNFGVPVEMGEAKVGPTVTQYTLKPAEGVKLSKILSLNDNLSLALAAYPIRIEAPVPGKSLVGIEVPNQATAVVPLKEILSSEQFTNRKSNLAIALGKDVMGKPWLVSLDTMPHLLVAGATGSGKSVCINSVILSLLFQNGPGELKFIMVDPKRVELPLYNGIPHLLTPVITDVKKTINSLRWAIKEMEKRFDTLSTSHHRNIASYNAKRTEDKMPYIVIVIDELADLMSAAGPEVEAAIVRLSQMSRAVGIHLVLATQRPSVDVITGLIKANITSRIAFSVASLVDSRTILDMSGAEKLLGRGDMLYISAEVSKPKRLQGAFASDDEIKRVINHLKKQAEPEYIEEVVEKQAGSTGYISTGDDERSDPLMEEAKEVIFKAKKASASLLQRRLRVGYARAARILDLLEAKGMIGPADGAKPREILVSSLEDMAEDDTMSTTPEGAYEEEEEETEDEEGDYEEEEEETEDEEDIKR